MSQKVDRRRINGPLEPSVRPLFLTVEEELNRKETALSIFPKNNVRLDGRQPLLHRPIFLRRGLVTQANGSAYCEAGNTKIACAVYGPRPEKIKQFTEQGRILTEFKFATFSCDKRRGYVRDDQEKEFSLIISQALSPAIRLELFPKSVLDVYVTVLQCDGTSAALSLAITAASVAIADAGVEMWDLVTACSLGYLNNQLYVDCRQNEEKWLDGDVVVARLGNLGSITHVHHSGRVNLETLGKALEVASETCSKLHSVSIESLKK